MKYTWVSISIVIILFGFSPITTVSATTFRYEFAGMVTSSVLHEYGENLPDIQAGDTFTGFLEYQYDSLLEDQIPWNPNHAAYTTFGSYMISFEDFILQSNISSYMPTEILDYSSTDTILLHDLDPDAGQYWSDDAYFSFEDPAGDAFADDKLPDGIDLTAFSDIALWFDIYGASGLEYCMADGLVKARIDSIRQVPMPVPEPAAYLLLLIGFCGFGIIKKKLSGKLS